MQTQNIKIKLNQTMQIELNLKVLNAVNDKKN